MQLVTKAGNLHTIDGCRITVRSTSAMPGYYADDLRITVLGVGEFTIASTHGSDYGDGIEIVNNKELVTLRDQIVEALLAKEDYLDLRLREEAVTT